MFNIEMPHIGALLADVPLEDQPEEELGFWKAVACELGEIIRYASQAEQPMVIFANFRKAGSQYIWEFAVNDLSIPRENVMNWHGQNTSQWLYAGALLLHNKRVSTHH